MLEYRLANNDLGPNTVTFGLTPLRIVFMGTPEFAVASLDALLQAGYNIVGVITAPDKPAGRGMKLTESAVKKFASEKGLNILQPVKLKDPVFLADLEALHADLQVVVAFRMLPEVVWNMPRLGSVNLHGSLLPQYRGAAPINWAVINGEQETGVTTFRLRQEIDTGEILLQASFPIGENETAGEVHDRMMVIGAAVLVDTVQGLAAGTLEAKPQPLLDASSDPDNPDVVVLKHAPKIFTETAKIDFELTTMEVHNLIRGLSPFPGAFTLFQNKTLKIYRSEKELVDPLVKPGEHVTDSKTFFKFACSDGYVHVKELQLEGKKKMAVGDFLRGMRF